jgi:PadR family transcriptional regulator PadR
MVEKRIVSREILLSFWKVHVLHHAAEDGVVGTWMLEELRHHGYEVSAGTLYPLLKRMEGFGWLTSAVDSDGPKARRTYFITEDGLEVLEIVKRQLKELGVEVVR